MTFEDGKRYIFDMETYLQHEDTDIFISFWVQECNQKEVSVIDKDNGCISIDKCAYAIKPIWCIEKPQNIRKTCILKEGEF